MRIFSMFKSQLKMSVITGFALAGVTLSGCSHMIATKEPVCRRFDSWEAGRTEGVAGLPLSAALKEQQCADVLDMDAFTNGHNAGLIDYCTPAQGLALGRNGQSYQHTCPSFLEGPFLQNYEAGLRLRTMETQIRTENASRTL